jgi:predicted dehydrogenase
VPEGLDWDFWCGPTPLVDYVELKQGNHTFTRGHYEFRWWYDYSGGKMTDWGAHHLDIAQWALGMDGSGPFEISAKGTPPSKAPNSYSCHADFEVTYKYPNDVTVIAMSRGENGVKIEGEDGWIFVGRGKIEASDKKLLETPLTGNAVKLEVSPGHMRNFFDCIKSRKKPICNVDVGASSVTICHLGVIALQTGKTLKWDAKAQKFDDAAANEMIGRKMRAPWKLDV